MSRWISDGSVANVGRPVAAGGRKVTIAAHRRRRAAGPPLGLGLVAIGFWSCVVAGDGDVGEKGPGGSGSPPENE